MIMEILVFLLVLSCLGSLPTFGDLTDVEYLLDNTIGSINNTLVDNLNISSANREYQKQLENATILNQEDRAKLENINTNHTLVQRKSSTNHVVSKANTKENERINNNIDDSASQKKEASTNQNTSTNSNTRKSKTLFNKFINITSRGDKNELITTQSVHFSTTKERNVLTNSTYSSTSILPRSRFEGKKKIIKPKANIQIKIFDNNEDFGRDCFEDLREHIGSKACYKVQCMENGVKFLIKDENSISLKPVAEFAIGRGSESSENCISLPGGDTPSKVCIHWQDMKWSKTQFSGCVVAKISDTSYKSKLTCFRLNCVEYKWGNKWIMPPTLPLLTPQKPAKGHKKRDFSKPSPNLSLDAKPKSNQLDVDIPFEEEDRTERAFDYVITLSPLKNIRKHPTFSVNEHRPNDKSRNKPDSGKPHKPRDKPKPGDKLKPEKTRKPGKDVQKMPNREKDSKLGDKVKPGKNHKPKKNKKPEKTPKPGKASKPGVKVKPGKNHKAENKPKPKGKTKPGKNHKPGNKHNPGKYPKQGDKIKPDQNLKPGNKPKPGKDSKLRDKVKSEKSHKPGNKPKPRDKQKPGNNCMPGGKTKPGNKSKLKQKDKAPALKNTENLTLKSVEVNPNEKVLDSQNNGIKRLGDISVVSSLHGVKPEPILAKPEIWKLIPHPPDTEIVYVLETSEKLQPPTEN